ncbi:bis(5'-nucleosyl)-tetraphosphatase (symmetrical) YqeK [Aureibacillus halotolerans]|uniref:bis(5'-nucleosyl)-tetraphosphatase (symmetrical) n=1 Tax=Aureibacillus halotolerans TaxID=1508390 RepID=A0A4R6U054_9BACI|nr:bis(5'-nucleosyl)-tetraphosphatase (symmetrical) YqeK [Aureibacillus halotolerans]TDQ38033.1 putative HD superfamily hydrolase involved in NAD metabolism [Aureibacillus halotolerans]
MYSLKQAEAFVAPKLTEARMTHTLGVVETAVELAERYSEDKDKTAFAAMLHDCAKCIPPDEQKQYMLDHNIGHDLLHFHHNTWHAVVGADLVRTQFAIEDDRVLYAIRYHTTGRQGMTTLEKIIFLADYIEPNRKFDGVDDVRDLAEKSLDAAIIKAMANTITMLVNTHQTVVPDTFFAYNDVLFQRKSKV